MTCKRLSQGLFILFSLIALSSFAFADTANYFYDDAGRLTRVAKGTEGVIYSYDEVGNLVSITKGTISANPPVIQSISPDVLFIGSTTLVSINGQNLFSTKEVASNNPSVSIKILNVNDTEIKAAITVAAGTSPGTISLTVTTLYGSANIQTTLKSSSLSFNPEHAAMQLGGSLSVTVSISPSLGRDIGIPIMSSDPAIASAPQLVTIPSSGTATFTINALQEGVATIHSGDPKTTVYITGSSILPPGELPLWEEIINGAAPVSVYIESSLGDSPIQSLPVSVYIDAPSGDASTVSLPVSIRVSGIDITDASAVSLPVSICIEAQAGEASTVSLPVSVYIEPLSGNTTTSSIPVSVYIEIAVGNATVASLPVSIKINPP